MKLSTDGIIDLLSSKGLIVIDKRKEMRDLAIAEGTYSKLRMRPNTVGVIVHQTLGNPDGNALDNIAMQHIVADDWASPAYFASVQRAGTVEILTNFYDRGNHVGKYNNDYVGIALHGTFTPGGAQPRLSQVGPAELLAACLLHVISEGEEGDVMEPDLLGHNELVGYELKNCPGFNMDIFRSAVGDLRHLFKPKANSEPVPAKPDPVKDDELSRTLMEVYHDSYGDWGVVAKAARDYFLTRTK